MPHLHSTTFRTEPGISYLLGQHFKVDPQHQQTLTLEHFSLWRWGGLFAFWDNTWYSGGRGVNGHHSRYGELTPRFSLGRILRRDLHLGPIRDVLLATTYEFGDGDVETFRFGPGFDLNVPGFNFFQLNFYCRIPQGNRSPKGSWQVVPAWSYSIAVGHSEIIIDGVIHWTLNSRHVPDGSRRQSYRRNLHINPQIKYDLGRHLGMGARSLFIGIEYDYWANKYGIADSRELDTRQNTASLLLKYHF